MGNGINLTKQEKSFMIIKFVINFFRCLLRFGVNDDFNGLAVNKGNSIENNIEGNKTFIGTIGFGVFSFYVEFDAKT